jgi:hypothetical protein
VSPSRFLLASVGASLAGALAGWAWGRIEARVAVPPRPPPRTAALEEALRAEESGDPAALAAALEGLSARSGLTASEASEAAFLEALASGERARLEEVADRHPGTTGAARALVELARRAASEAEVSAWRARLRAGWPGSWAARGAGP